MKFRYIILDLSGDDNKTVTGTDNTELARTCGHDWVTSVIDTERGTFYVGGRIMDIKEREQ